jgi:hypothetical protein
MRKKTIKTTIEEICEEGVICIDVPLMIRLLEYAREDSSSDIDLHVLATNAIELSECGRALTMEHYSKIVPEAPETPTAPV